MKKKNNNNINETANATEMKSSEEQLEQKSKIKFKKQTKHFG